jgi:hypothetical protein
MALLFNTDILTKDGFTLSNAYGRVAAYDSYEGTKVSGQVDIFVSEQAFLTGKTPVKTNLIQNCVVPYDRKVDGTDILEIAHIGLIDQLAAQNIVATKQL